MPNDVRGLTPEGGNTATLSHIEYSRSGYAILEMMHIASQITDIRSAIALNYLQSRICHGVCSDTVVENRETEMRKLKILEHISLDGVIQHSADDGDFPYGDWTAPYRTPEGRDAILALQGENFDLLLGRRTYDIWSGYWPKAPASPMADGLNAATKYVATHRPESLEWGPFEGFGGDIAEAVHQIKAQDGPDLVVWGSSTLTPTLLEQGLADEVVLAVYPVLLGTGKRFLADGSPAHALELISSKAMPSGIILNTYELAGPLKTG